MDLMFARLSPELRRFAIRKVGACLTPHACYLHASSLYQAPPLWSLLQAECHSPASSAAYDCVTAHGAVFHQCLVTLVPARTFQQAEP